jgi:hypothetical protein
MIRADSLWDAGSVSGDAINGGIARIGESRRSGFSTTDRKIAFGRLPDTPWSRHTYFLCTGFQSGRCPIEPATSAVSRQYDTLLEISGAYKIPANGAIAAEIICSGFQEGYPGCCTARQRQRARSGAASLLPRSAQDPRL